MGKKSNDVNNYILWGRLVNVYSKVRVRFRSGFGVRHFVVMVMVTK